MFISLCQRWNKHYCVISDDKLYYAEEYEDEDEDPRKVEVANFKYQVYGSFLDMWCNEL